jgi:hypothetical protein
MSVNIWEGTKNKNFAPQKVLMTSSKGLSDFNNVLLRAYYALMMCNNFFKAPSDALSERQNFLHVMPKLPFEK